MIKKVILPVIIFVLVFNNFQGNHVYAMGSAKLEAYCNIVNEVNDKYGRQFEITDMEAFQKYVINKMSIKEFEAMLEKDAQEFENDIKINIIDIPKTRTSVSIVELQAIVTKGTNKLSKVFAEFEIVDLNSVRYFNKYIAGGNLTTSTTWYLQTLSTTLVSMSSTKATVKYKGYWRYGPTGLSETTLETYTIVYTP